MVFPVIVAVAMRVIPPAIKAVRAYYKYEKKAIGKAWQIGGYPKNVVKAVQHGSLVGSVIGSAFSPSEYGETPQERSPDSVGKTRGNVVSSRSGSKYSRNNYSNNERANALERLCRKRRRYRS